jgi:hypothetical protein
MPRRGPRYGCSCATPLSAAVDAALASARVTREGAPLPIGRRGDQQLLSLGGLPRAGHGAVFVYLEGPGPLAFATLQGRLLDRRTRSREVIAYVFKD